MRARPRARGTRWLIAVGGILLLAILAAQIAGIKIYRITSGSMHPTIAEGSLILTQRVAASELVVGDIVTVQRSPGSRTVTHRVTGVDSGANRNLRNLTLQGDANATPDPSVYSVDAAQRYLFTLFKE